MGLETPKEVLFETKTFRWRAVETGFGWLLYNLEDETGEAMGLYPTLVDAYNAAEEAEERGERFMEEARALLGLEKVSLEELVEAEEGEEEDPLAWWKARWGWDDER